MSWDVVMIRTKNNDEDFDSINDDDMIKFFKKEVIDVIVKISEEIGAVAEDLDTEYAHLRGNDWSIEFQFWDNEPYDTIVLEVRGIKAPKEAFQLLKGYLKARIFDLYSGRYVDDQPELGFEEWKKLCDKIINSLTNSSESE